MEETISLREIFQTLKKRFWLITLLTILATATSGIISYNFLTPIYQSSTQILVNQSKTEQPAFNVNDIRTNLELINTYNVIIKSPAILDIVKEELELDESTNLNGKITVGSVQNSQVVDVTVQDADSALAAEIANTTATVFQEEIVKIMNVDNVSILSRAVESESPVKPNPMLNMAIALVVGLMAGVGIAFLLEYLDNTVKNEQDIERLLGLPVLGAIAQIDIEAEAKKQAAAQAEKGLRGETLGS
ncbi:capsular biosynthesis protein [Bacillus timonensis]|nr:capsular biosynthesis protein [Bacillus timonensis]